MESGYRLPAIDWDRHGWWVQPLFVVTAFVIVDRSLRGLLHLPYEAYLKPVIAVEAMVHVVKQHSLLLIAVGCVLGGVAWAISSGRLPRRRVLSVFDSWDALDEGRKLRWLVTVNAVALGWYLATLAPNYYFGHTFSIDRLLIVGACLLVAWRPVFVFLLLAVVVPFIGQLDYPLAGYSWAGHALPRGMLTVLGAFLLVRVFRPDVRARVFVTVACCLIATNYFWSGVEKLRLGWLWRENIQYLLPASYTNGWLAQLQPPSLEMLTRWFAIAGWPLKAFTLFVEVGAIAFFASRIVSRVLLVGWVVLHAGIFATTGICFWMWVAADVAMLTFFFVGREDHEFSLDWRRLAVSSLLVIAGMLWARPIALAWLDSPVAYAFRFESVDADGAPTHLSPRFFAPNDYETTLGGLSAFLEDPVLPVAAGATRNRGILERLKSAKSADEVLQIERRYGRVRKDSVRAARLDRFFVEFIGRRNTTRGSYWWKLFSAPPILWTITREPAHRDGHVPLLRVYHVTSRYDGVTYAILRKRLVREYRFADEAQERD